MSTPDIKKVVKEKYGQAALRVTGGGSSCCGASAACGCDPITSNLYDASQAGQIPEEAMLASLGCGNPTALAKLSPGGSFLISVRAAGSMSFSQPNESGQPEEPTGWI